MATVKSPDELPSKSSSFLLEVRGASTPRVGVEEAEEADVEEAASAELGLDRAVELSVAEEPSTVGAGVEAEAGVEEEAAEAGVEEEAMEAGVEEEVTEAGVEEAVEGTLRRLQCSCG